MSSSIMAVQTVSSKPAVLAAKSSPSSSTESKQSKMHRRSRTGCFTCRLRRKKCDEGKPGCKACRKLAICCEYKRPMWWGNAEQRKNHKEVIKNQIKALKLQEKQAQSQHITMPTSHTPPSLYHSPSIGMARTRGGSMDSSIADPFDFNGPLGDMFTPQIVQSTPSVVGPFGFQPFQDTVKVETEYYYNEDVVRKDSTISTSFFEPLPSTEEQPFMDNWVQRTSYDHQQHYLTNENIDFTVFDFNQSPHLPLPIPATVPSQTMMVPQNVQVEGRDKYLLDHFQAYIAPKLFPMLKLNISEQCQQQLIESPLKNNEAFFHAALASAALNIKLSNAEVNQDLEDDLIRHVSQTVSFITRWLEESTELNKITEAALAMIYMNNLVAGVEHEGRCELPWDSHFSAVQSTIDMLNLTDSANSTTIATWIDILGATMTGKKPMFADLYRERMTLDISTGLSPFTGCDDRIFYLISEIASLESAKTVIDNITLCMHITSLGEHISKHEQSSPRPQNCFGGTGIIDGAQLSANITHIFRLAARIFLCSLVPDFDMSAPNIVNLVDSLAEALAFIPAGPEGFDRALVWPLLMAGGVSKPGSKFRSVFAERVALMDTTAGSGAFLRMHSLLTECWRINDDNATRGEQSVHWRDVMDRNNWKFLLI